MTGDNVAALESWFATSYADPSARVARSLPRTSGGLYELTGANHCWLRVGGVMQRGSEQAEAEAWAATALGDRGIRVARPLARADGRFAGPVELGGRQQVALAYRHVPGEELDQPTRVQAEQLGKLVAELHALPVAEITPRGSLPAVEPIRAARESARRARRWLATEDARWLERAVEGALEQLERMAVLDKTVVCHGDLRLGNARFAAGLPTLIDLEALGRGPRSYDLGCLWRRRVVESDFTGVPQDWNWFRHGYETVLEIPDDEWQALPLLALLRAVWTMCLPAQPDATWGASWRQDPDYWAAHLRMIRWFAGAATV